MIHCRRDIPYPIRGTPETSLRAVKTETGGPWWIAVSHRPRSPDDVPNAAATSWLILIAGVDAGGNLEPWHRFTVFVTNTLAILATVMPGPRA
jgi:hypothetical protein